MSNANWKNNHIQFPRLIAEIQATGALDCVPQGHTSERIIDLVAVSMDLDVSQVYELIERAIIKWDNIVART